MLPLKTRYGRLPFSPHYQFVLRKPLHNEGVQYQAGDVIDLTDGFSERRLLQLYENWFTQVRTDDAGVPMSIIDPVAAPQKPAPAADRAPKPEASTSAADGTTASPTSDGAPGAPAPRYAKHTGFGKWFIFEGDKEVGGPYTKDQALKLAPKAAA